MRLALDAGARRTDGGRVLIGGAPLRVLRLTAAGARALDALEAGAPVGVAPTSQWLARRLLDAGVAHPRPATAPFAVCIVIPVRDRPAGLASTLDALSGVAGGRVAGGGVAGGGAVGGGAVGGGARLVDGVEVVVVDDGSTGEGTSLVASRAGATVLRHAAPHGPGAARNTGAKATHTEIIAFVDADCAPPAGWLDALLPHFTDEAVGAVAPRVVAGGRVGAPAWLEAYERSRSPLDRGPAEAPVRPRGAVPFVPAAALLVRRQAFEEVGGFDEGMPVGEDVDFVWRLADAGWTVRYEPAVAVVHPVRPDIVAWLRQRYGYGTSAAPLASRHAGAVAPLTVSAWSALTWALAALRRPLAGASVAAATTALLARRLGALEHPAQEAFALAGKGHLAAGRLCADAVRRPWWPLALIVALLWRRARPGVAAAFLVPPAMEWVQQRPQVGLARWLAARVADDMAYGAGVWAGALRMRSLGALAPDLSNWPGRRPAVEG
jgi:mycofactocin system glycosyltransferase